MPPRIAGDSRRQTLKYDALANGEFVADPVCGAPPSAFSCFRIAFTRIVRVSWCFSSSCLRASALSQPLVGRRLCQPQVGGSIPPCGSHVWTLSPRLVATATLVCGLQLHEPRQVLERLAPAQHGSLDGDCLRHSFLRDPHFRATWNVLERDGDLHLALHLRVVAFELVRVAQSLVGLDLEEVAAEKVGVLLSRDEKVMRYVPRTLGSDLYTCAVYPFGRV